MEKGIIVVDKKNACLDCQFCREIMEGIEACCELTIDENDDELFKMIDADYCQEVPKWCPIIGIEELNHRQYETKADFNYICGWNHCIERILNGGNDGKE